MEGKGRNMSGSNKTKVVVKRTVKDDDSDKFAVMMDALKEAGFWEALDSKWKASGKTKAQFSIVVKPNLMMFYSTKDKSVYTDPTMVEYLIDRMYEKGFTKIALIESQNVYGNWFKKRDVLNVAKIAGFHDNKNYRIVDISKEKVPHKYPGRLGQHFVGPTWRDADFRINFAKNKTHFSCYYTLCIKNVYGTTPLQDKFLEYHKNREITWVTVEMIKEFPVHFNIVDGILSADGIMGIKADWTPKKTKIVIAGENIIAVDWVGAELMGLDPMRSIFTELAVTVLGMPDIKRVGDMTPHPDWDNVPEHIDTIFNMGEEFYGFSNWLGFVSSEMDPVFPMKVTAVFTLGFRWIFLGVLRLVSYLE
jgi:uncharacterized protein (DUF362 family)